MSEPQPPTGGAPADGPPQAAPPQPAPPQPPVSSPWAAPGTPTDPWTVTIPHQPTYDAPDSSGQPPVGWPPAPPYGPAPAYGQPAYPPAPYPPAPAGWPAGQPAPAYGWTPPRKSRTGLIIGVVGAIVVVVGALLAIGVSLGGSPAKTAAGGPATTGGITPGDGRGLLAAIVTPGSAGRVHAVAGTSDGVMTLNQLVSLSFGGDEDEKAILTDRGFEVAAQREWIDSTSTQIDIQLIQFADVDGAEAHVSAQRRAFGTDASVTHQFDLPGVTDGRGFENSHLDSYHNRRATIIGRSRNVAVLIFVFTPHNFDRSVESATMAAQVAKLGG